MMKSLFRIFLFAMMLLPVACAEIELPAQLQVIEAEAFCGASELSAVRLCEGITEIRVRAFADSGLTEISLPRSLSSIADSAFDGCGNVVIEVLPDTYAWDWCIAQGMTGAALTSVEQTDNDSAHITWSAPDGILCDVLLNPGDEWSTAARALTGGEYTIDNLLAGREYTFALEFYGTETVHRENTSLSFTYSLRSDEQTLFMLGFEYSWWIQDGECILTGAKPLAGSTSVELHIPSELGGFPVRRIGSKAFTCSSALKSVFIPDTVQIIDSTAFYGCRNLESVTMSDSVQTIGDYAFADCPALTNVRLSDSIVSIGEYAFRNDAALTQIELPAALTSLGKKALYGTGLTSLSLPDKLTQIGVQAWDDDISRIIVSESATSLSVLDGILYAGNMTELFWIPRTLTITEYTAPETVAKISAFAFTGHSKLQRAEFPGGLNSIGESAFASCTSLENISGLENLISIGDNAFSGCAALMDSSFQTMTRLEAVGAFAFSGCAALENMPLPECLNYLGECAFENCTGLKAVALGTEMRAVGDRAFYECGALEQIAMPAALTDCEEFGSHLFYNCAKLQSASVPSGVTELENHAFYGCTGLSSVSLPNTLKKIGASAFYKCNALTGLSLPTSVTSIGGTAFTYCKSLTELNLPACSVGKNCFSVCTGLRNVSFAESKLRNITLDERAFYYCTALEGVYLPENVTAIHDSAFDDCKNVTLYVYENSNAHTFALQNGLPYEIVQP